MKKYFATVFSALAVCISFGAANDTLISFSTPGPDKYADGTTVADGECYALVWTKAGAAFAGITADGKAVDPTNAAVLVYAPVAKAGRCPTVVFEIDADAAANYTNGEFSVYLLDTRLANGAVGGLSEKGVPAAVNGYGAVAEESPDAVTASERLCNLQPPKGVTVTAKSALPADAPNPKVTAIRIAGDNVYLTVKNTLPCLKYAASAATTPGGAATAQSAATQGAAGADDEITVIVPKTGDAGFYSVGRE